MDIVTPRSIWVSLTKSSLRRQALGNYVLKIANMGLTFAGSVVLARVLGPEQFGVYSFAYSVLMILAIVAEFGLPTLVVRETAKGMARKEYGLVRGIWGWAVKISSLLSLGLIVVSGIFFLQGKWLPANRRETVLWALAILPLLALGDIRNAALRGLKKVIAGQLPEFLLRPALHLGLVIVLWWQGAQTTASLAMQLYLLAAGLAFLTGLWLWYVHTFKDIFHAPTAYSPQTWRGSIFSLGVLEIMGVVNLYIATVMQGFFHVSDADIGIFRIAQQLAQLSAFGLAINMVLGPRFAALYSEGNIWELQKLARFSARIVTFLFISIEIFFVLLGKPFLKIALGIDYINSYVLLMVLLLGQFVNAAVGSVGWILNMAHRERTVMLITMFSLFLNIFLHFILLPLEGVLGSAIAVSISVAVWNGLAWYYAKKQIGVNSFIFGGIVNG